MKAFVLIMLRERLEREDSTHHIANIINLKEDREREREKERERREKRRSNDAVHHALIECFTRMKERNKRR